MIVVNGVNGSGVEAVMNTFDLTIGARNACSEPYDYRQAIKDSGVQRLADYETYLDKFNTADRNTALGELEALTPDGVWPTYNISPEAIRPIMGGKILSWSAVRLGGSVFNMNDDEIDKIYIVLASPVTVYMRRSALHMQYRRLGLKYINDYSFPRALTMQTRGMSVIPAAMEEELVMFSSYVNNCLYRFGDKVAFIDGNSEVLSFDHDGGRKTAVINRNIHKHADNSAPEGSLEARVAASPEFKKMLEVWGRLQDMAATRKFEAAAPRLPVPTMWFCARTHKTVNVATCLRCSASRGDYVIADARPGWDQEPCAYEVAYGPGPYKTVAQSIADHSWGVLP